MRRILISLLLSLMMLSSGSCTSTTPVLVQPNLEIPARPVMLDVPWQHDIDSHCLDDVGVRALLINISRLQNHIKVLEGYLNAAGN